MIIPSSNITKYLHSVKFPVQIFAEKGKVVALTVGRADLMRLIELDVVVGIGIATKLKRLRLQRPTNIIQLRDKLAGDKFPFAEDSKTTYLDVKTHFHHYPRSEAYKEIENLPISEEKIKTSFYTDLLKKLGKL